jgi:S-adenosylmethionine synthetase
VTIQYRIENGACVPIRVHTVVISTQHSADVSLEQLRSDLLEYIIRPVIPSDLLDENTVFHLNPCGTFIVGGPKVRDPLVQ